MFSTKLYVHCAKGTEFKPGSLVGEHALKADYIVLENGDAIGVVSSITGKAREILESQPGITVLPPLHRPIKAHHAKVFAHAGAVEGDIAYDVAEKVYLTHKMPWMHPEETAIIK